MVQISYGGTSCYVQINNDGKKTIEKGHENNVWHGFSYKEKVHEKSGKEKVLEFTSTHNLRKQAYLKLTYNKGKGVTNWEEIKKSEVPICNFNFFIYLLSSSSFFINNKARLIVLFSVLIR